MSKIIYAIVMLACVLPQLPAQSFGSLYSDVKARQVGDVLSVIIVETANATRESKSQNSTKSDMNIDGSVGGTLTSFLPAFGASSAVDKSYNGTEGTQQNEKLTGRIAVRITEITDNGMIKIAGERTLEVNGEKNLMKLEGFVRQRDIQTNNTVFSYNIADAQITYKKSGIMNKLVKPGTFTRLLTYGIGAGLVAAAVTKMSFK